MSIVIPAVIAISIVGLLSLASAWGYILGERRERRRCFLVVKDHFCSDCYTRHCLLKMASVIKLEVVDDPE